MRDVHIHAGVTFQRRLAIVPHDEQHGQGAGAGVGWDGEFRLPLIRGGESAAVRFVRRVGLSRPALHNAQFAGAVANVA